MPSSFASKIVAANTMLLVDGDLCTIDTFFTPDYLAHVTDLAERLLLARKAAS